MPLLEQCDMGVLAALSAPVAASAAPAIVTGRTSTHGVDLVGARASFLSEHDVPAWARVLRTPEETDDWHPPSMGTRRVERLDPGHIFQQLDITILLGAVHIRRQIVVGSTWLENTASAAKICWYGTDPSRYQAQIAPWVDDSTWETVTFGSWEVRARPEGGSTVSYQFWSPSKSLLPQIQAWAMARMLPEMMRVTDAHVGALDGAVAR